MVFGGKHPTMYVFVSLKLILTDLKKYIQKNEKNVFIETKLVHVTKKKSRE